MKTKAINSYSVSGSRMAMDKKAKQAHKQFRQSRKSARGSVWLLACELKNG